MIDYISFRKDAIKRRTAPEILTKSIIEKIQKTKDINAFISVNETEALQQAEESTRRFIDGKPRKLEGMIIAIKDNISMRGSKMTCGSRMLENFDPVYDATVIEKIKAEGGILIGKTNMDEFAMGSSNENSYFGAVKNPHDHERVPGGSSGGSAVAVAAGLCHAALGSDTGGSIRQPAAFCGIYGVKPTYGRVSRYGLTAFASSLDQIGVFAPSAETTALLMDVISGEDKNDSTTAPIPAPQSFLNIEKTRIGKKVGIINANVLEGIDKRVLEAYRSMISKLRSSRYELVEVDFPSSKYWIPAYYIVATAEASSNLSRYDGVRFGYRAETLGDEDFTTKTRSEGFGEEVKRRIMLGTFVLSSGYYDAYYKKALQVRRLIYNDYAEAFKKADVLLLPTTPTPAFKIGEKISDPIAMYLSDFFTASANLAGVPAISFPAGETDDSLPLALQLQTNHFKEEQLMAAVKQFSLMRLVD